MPIALEHREDEGWEGVFVALDAHDAGRTLEFQRALAPTAEDVRLGMDKVSVGRDGATSYGCITRVEQLDARTMRLALTPEGAAELGLEPRTDIACDDVDDITPAVERLRAMLEATGELRP